MILVWWVRVAAAVVVPATRLKHSVEEVPPALFTMSFALSWQLLLPSVTPFLNSYAVQASFCVGEAEGVEGRERD